MTASDRGGDSSPGDVVRAPDLGFADGAVLDSNAVDATRPPQDTASNTGCEIDGIAFNADEASCALQFFETMSCETCDALFDSRICEDAINDANACMIGDSCSGCSDDDSRADGISCAEIENYGYFGATAAQALLSQVQSNPCGSNPSDAGSADSDSGPCVANCGSRVCGPEPHCGESCGDCEAVSPSTDCADSYTRTIYSGAVDCMSGQCVPQSSDEACPLGELCSDGSCVSQPDRCGSSADCGVGNHCTTRTKTCITGECASDYDCDLGEGCRAGSCVFIPIGSLCEENIDCGVGRHCSGVVAPTCQLWQCSEMSDCQGVGVDPDALSADCATRDGYEVCVYLNDIPCKSDWDCGIADRCDPYTYTCTRFTNESWTCPCSSCKSCLNYRCLADIHSGICWGGADCRGGNYCASSGYCEDWSCRTNLECSYGNACVTGSFIQCDTSITGSLCRQRWGYSCDAGTNCGNGMLCASGECLPASSCGSSADCPEHWGCPSSGSGAHLCHPWYEISCARDEDCPIMGGGRCTPD
ncbi:MAG: hypothetical protein JRH20_13755 [Deltaproteobacteria bacterium]|nr:hypothetical protein [Deltaproteobacteria bacterium]